MVIATAVVLIVICLILPNHLAIILSRISLADHHGQAIGQNVLVRATIEKIAAMPSVRGSVAAHSGSIRPSRMT
jgi:hypothetical protein